MTKSTNTKIDSLSSKSSNLVSLSKADRLNLIDEITACIKTKNWAESGDWIKKEMALTGFAPSPNNIFEYSDEARNHASTTSYVFIATLMDYLQTLRESLEYQLSIEKSVNPDGVVKPVLLANVREEETPEGNVSVHGPKSIPLTGMTCEVWCSPESYKNKHEGASKTVGGVTLVLGAGNVSCLTFIDTLHCLFMHPRKPVLVKHHPLRPYLFNLMTEIFEPLMKRGFLNQVLDKDITHTQSMLAHEDVAHIHFTGALSTDKAIKSFLAKSRKDLTEEDVQAMVTSELGCVTPWIFSKGRYTDIELLNSAKQIATAKKSAGGAFCLAAQAIILPKSWEQKDQLKEFIMDELKNTPSDPCYYPGTAKRCGDMIEHYNKVGNQRVKIVDAPIRVKKFDGKDASQDMQTAVIDCGTFETDDYDGLALNNEAFGPVLAFVELLDEEEDDESYLLKTAIPFVNNKENIYGSLSCVLLKPINQETSILKKAIASLTYGSVCVNIWSLYGYNASVHGGTWGGHRLEQKGQSGTGYIGNAFLIPNVDKTVVYGPPLSTAPALDLRKTVPTVVFNVLSQIKVAKSYSHAFMNVGILVIVRLISWFISNIWRTAKRPYGSPI